MRHLESTERKGANGRDGCKKEELASLLLLESCDDFWTVFLHLTECLECWLHFAALLVAPFHHVNFLALRMPPFATWQRVRVHSARVLAEFFHCKCERSHKLQK